MSEMANRATSAADRLIGDFETLLRREQRWIEAGKTDRLAVVLRQKDRVAEAIGKLGKDSVTAEHRSRIEAILQIQRANLDALGVKMGAIGDQRRSLHRRRPAVSGYLKAARGARPRSTGFTA